MHNLWETRSQKYFTSIEHLQCVNKQNDMHLYSALSKETLKYYVIKILQFCCSSFFIPMLCQKLLAWIIKWWHHYWTSPSPMSSVVKILEGPPLPPTHTHTSQNNDVKSEIVHLFSKIFIVSYVPAQLHRLFNSSPNWYRGRSFSLSYLSSLVEALALGSTY